MGDLSIKPENSESNPLDSKLEEPLFEMLELRLTNPNLNFAQMQKELLIETTFRLATDGPEYYRPFFGAKAKKGSNWYHSQPQDKSESADINPHELFTTFVTVIETLKKIIKSYNLPPEEILPTLTRYSILYLNFRYKAFCSLKELTSLLDAQESQSLFVDITALNTMRLAEINHLFTYLNVLIDSDSETSIQTDKTLALYFLIRHYFEKTPDNYNYNNAFSTLTPQSIINLEHFIEILMQHKPEQKELIQLLRLDVTKQKIAEAEEQIKSAEEQIKSAKHRLKALNTD